MTKSTINKIFLFAFIFLYCMVALISFCHAIEFFDIGNVKWMSTTLAFAFELGLAVCLASILLSPEKRNTVTWLLLSVLVFVQVCGNTYSVFKYISESHTEYYQYLSKPLLFWIEEVSEETIQVIVSWIMGAILPIVALFMTEMVAERLKPDEQNIQPTIQQRQPNKEEKKKQIQNIQHTVKNHDQTTPTERVAKYEPTNTTTNPNVQKATPLVR